MKLLVSNIKKSNRDYGRFSCLMIRRFEVFLVYFGRVLKSLLQLHHLPLFEFFMKLNLQDQHAKHNSKQRTLGPAAYNEKCLIRGREDYLACMMGETPHQSQRNIFPLALRVEQEQSIHNPYLLDRQMDIPDFSMCYLPKRHILEKQ